jgi:predicted dithiol-disulfide oxidoreductase (DUF899 family)
MTMNHPIVSREEWLAARKQLLLKEKELTHVRETLSRERRALPWVRVDKRYVFQGASGEVTLPELFQGRSQLLVYHFMFAPEWEAGCKSCSFWADHFNGMVPHLAQRDVSFTAISRAPFSKLQAFQRRLGWSFPWVSSGGTDFNFDYAVSFTPEELAEHRATYNYGPLEFDKSDLPGISAFYKDARGDVFHTYSCYARGVEAVNTTYQFLDLAPKGRDEQGLAHPMAWVKLHDEYR